MNGNTIIDKATASLLVSEVERCQNAANLHTTNMALWFFEDAVSNANTDTIDGQHKAYLANQYKIALEAFLVHRDATKLDKERKRIYAYADTLFLERTRRYPAKK